MPKSHLRVAELHAQLWLLLPAFYWRGPWEAWLVSYQPHEICGLNSPLPATAIANIWGNEPMSRRVPSSHSVFLPLKQINHFYIEIMFTTFLAPQLMITERLSKRLSVVLWALSSLPGLVLTPILPQVLTPVQLIYGHTYSWILVKIWCCFVERMCF